MVFPVVLAWVFGAVFLAIAVVTARLLGGSTTEASGGEGLTAVILPCRGEDPAFSDLLDRLQLQTFNSCCFYFVVADEHDAAVSAIDDWLEEQPLCAKRVVYPPPPGYSGKIANMLGGYNAALRDNAQYLIFLDSDTVPAPDFVARMVAPLVRNQAMLTTGARVLVPQKDALPQWVASLWLLTSLPGVVRPQQGSAWGGAMAIRTEDATRLDLKRVWSGAFSDDHTLSEAVRNAGGQIVFVPEGTLSIPIDFDWSEMLDFMVRQLVTIRIHDKRLWLLTWILLYPMLLLATALLSLLNADYLASIMLLTSLFPPALAYLHVNETVWRQLGIDSVRLRSQPVWISIVSFALLIVVHPLVLLQSALRNRFVWRGWQYRIKDGQILLVDDGGDSPPM